MAMIATTIISSIKVKPCCLSMTAPCSRIAPDSAVSFLLRMRKRDLAWQIPVSGPRREAGVLGVTQVSSAYQEQPAGLYLSSTPVVSQFHAPDDLRSSAIEPLAIFGFPS